MIFLAILFALSILVIEYTIAQKFLEKDASIQVYAGGIVVVLFIAIIDGLLFTMGLTEKVDVTATYLGLCLPSGLLLLAFARMLFGVIKKMAQENSKSAMKRSRACCRRISGAFPWRRFFTDSLRQRPEAACFWPLP